MKYKCLDNFNKHRENCTHNSLVRMALTSRVSQSIPLNLKYTCKRSKKKVSKGHA